MSEPTIPSLSGLLPIFKPSGMSSYDVIRRFKKYGGYKGKIGHAGTLDVFAEGLLILMLGKATKQFDELQTRDKVYRAGVRFGYRSNTLDIEGILNPQAELDSDDTSSRPSLAALVNAAEGFEGEIEQAVPAYSAAKQDGQSQYKLARQGKKVKPKSKRVTIYDINVVTYMYPLATIDVRCSSGTYIRQLTWDIGQQLGLDSFLFSLRRERIGTIGLEQAAALPDLMNDRWREFVLETA